MEATQESTQPCTDPRRLGRINSGLQEHDVSDIVCILHPNSPAAHDAVAATATLGPQHILQKDVLGRDSMDTAALDIALRFSSDVRDLKHGFIFGRHQSRSDILLTPDDAGSKRLSNVHFRIYLTENGILMFQDTSTNGSLVDNCQLRKMNKNNNSRMLLNGSVIQVVNGDPGADIEVRFIVRIPSREGHEMQYTENLIRYLGQVRDLQDGAAQPRSRQSSAQPVLPFATTQPYGTYGMNWSGGDKYNVTGQIGKGAFAIVYKLATKQHGVVYAAKELDKRRFMKHGILDPKVDNEMRIMRDLKHPNIVQYIDHHEHDRWIYIIMEYVPFGELSTYLQNSRGLPENLVQQVAHQVLHALRYLHKRKITHRDIKPDNILISSLDPLSVKLSDFGLSKVVQEEETFLKTFCGTLLYCAPEIYPNYDDYRRGEVRKRRRFGDPPPKTTPYSQSVDTWSLGAVLFHVLAGTPPYMGSGEDKGSSMLRTIMTTDPDYNLFRQAGVSEIGIDFVSQLLNRDPLCRPRERESLQHPWIANIEDVDEYEADDMNSDYGEGLSDIGEDEEGELDASQLSIHDEEERQDSFDGDELVQSKRPRIEHPPAEIRYPSLPNIESINKDGQPPPETTPKRLFGEISQPALRSSHALGASVEAYIGDDFSARDFISSAGESIISGGYSLNSIMSLPEFPFGGSAPSLMGAENQVRQLHMSSSLPVISDIRHQGMQTPARKASPTDRNEAPTDGNAPDIEQTNPSDDTPKASKFNRRIQIPIPDTASESSSDRSQRESPKDRRGESPIVAAVGEAAGEEFNPELAVTLDAETGKAIRDRPKSNCQVYADSAARQEPGIASIPRAVPAPQSRKTRPLLGKLTSLPGSIFDLTIRLEERMTSWGRGPQATICHPDSMDTRIPAYALEVTFWSPAIESRIADGDDWMNIPGVMAILSTKTRKCIWVNDMELRRGEDDGREGFQFGKLYTGDIITVYKHRNRFLKFQCEFYHGDSARSRPDQEKGFVVRKVLKSKEDGNANRLPVQKNNNQKK